MTRVFTEQINSFLTDKGVEKIVIDAENLSRKERATLHAHCTKLGLHSQSDEIEKGKKKLIVTRHKQEDILRVFHLDPKSIKRFASIACLPIPYCSPKTIGYYLRKLESSHPGCTKLFELYCEDCKKFNVTKELNKVTHEVAQYIRKHPQVIALRETDPLNGWSVDGKRKEGQRNPVYKHHNANKHFVSFDMIRGYLNAVRKYCPDLIPNGKTWEEFMGTFTKSEFITLVKKNRQAIFGNSRLSEIGKRLCEYEVFALDDFISSPKSNEHSDLFGQAVFKYNDEVVYELPDLAEDTMQKVTDAFQKYGSKMFRIEFFTLKKIEDTSWFYKLRPDGSWVLKTVPNTFAMQAISIVNGEKIKNLDLLGTNGDGRVFKYEFSVLDKVKDLGDVYSSEINVVS